MSATNSLGRGSPNATAHPIAIQGRSESPPIPFEASTVQGLATKMESMQFQGTFKLSEAIEMVESAEIEQKFASVLREIQNLNS